MRPGTLRELAAEAGFAVPVLPEQASFDEFMNLYGFACSVVRTPAHIGRVVSEIAEDAARDGAVWVEVHFDTTMHGEAKATEGTVERFRDAAAAATAGTGVGIGLVMAVDRTRPVEVALEQARLASRYADRGVVGIGLVNAEAGYPPEPFAEAFGIARNAGLRSVPHAGEFAGPESVRGALDTLGASRLGHGVRAVEDPELLTHLADEGICLDVCPTSNLALGVYNDCAAHPLPGLLARGIPVSLNADNPLLSGTGLLEEYERARADFALDDTALADIASNSIRNSAMPPEEQQRALAGIDAWREGSPPLQP
jgi:adenosine deaminase